jgi:hypothetical protein
MVVECLQEIVHEVHVLEILDGHYAVCDHVDEVWQQVELHNSWYEIFITGDAVQSVDGLKSNSFVFAGEINTRVQEVDGVFESLGILFVENIDDISQEETVADLYKFAVALKDLVDVDRQNLFDTVEDAGVGRLGINIAENRQHHH